MVIIKVLGQEGNIRANLVLFEGVLDRRIQVSSEGNLCKFGPV